jgi:putative ABC transport system substrate-binding protein
VEHRFPAEKPERFQSMAAELVALKIDILVAAGQPPALALQRATEILPIVFVAAYCPLRRCDSAAICRKDLAHAVSGYFRAEY